VSCFDERLSEDSKVNCLEDSFLLFREICGSKLLAKATMILFLNKCDLLKRKLRAGVQVKHYLPSFGARPNEAGAVVKCTWSDYLGVWGLWVLTDVFVCRSKGEVPRGDEAELAGAEVELFLCYVCRRTSLSFILFLAFYFLDACRPGTLTYHAFYFRL
jgi:hypothetical protein